MAVFPPILERRLAELQPAGLRRSLKVGAGVDLASNDYLGFGRDPELARRLAQAVKELQVGSTGSRLLRGELPIHEDAEAALARFVGREASTLFPSGYQANLALLSSLLRPGDLVFSDELNHASLIDGIRLSRARKVLFPHRDTAALRGLLARHAAERTPGQLALIVTESLFSMDGDLAPLQGLANLAEEFDALLVVDEAHATGLFGAGVRSRESGGGGLVQALGLTKRVFATVHTGGKALGIAGAWVAGPAQLKDYLVNFARPFIFSTAPTPALAASLQLAVGYWGEVGRQRAQEVLERARSFQRMLGSSQVAAGPIVPILLGENRRAVAVAERLQRQGFDARAIRPPTVPEGTARLRLTVTWPVGMKELETFAGALKAALREASE